MTAKLSPKMQKLVDEMAEGTKIVAEIYGDFEAYIREADGRTHNGRSINATAKALIARGILVKGEGHYWVLAGTETSAEAPAEAPAEIPADEAPEFTPLAEGNLVARIGEETKMKTMAATGNVVHAATNNGLRTVCQPYGSMGARPKRYRRCSDSYTINCKQCLRKLAAAESDAYEAAASL